MAQKQYKGEALKDASNDRQIICQSITLALLGKAEYCISLSLYMYLCTAPFLYLFGPIFSNNLKREFVHTSKYHLTRNFQSNPQLKINSVQGIHLLNWWIVIRFDSFVRQFGRFYIV